MTRDHEFLVGGERPDRHPAVAPADAGTAGGIGGSIEREPEPRRLLAHPRSDLGRALADAAGEDERIEPAERGGERAELAKDAIDEQPDGLPRPRILAFEQVPHIVAD